MPLGPCCQFHQVPEAVGAGGAELPLAALPPVRLDEREDGGLGVPKLAVETPAATLGSSDTRLKPGRWVMRRRACQRMTA